MKLLPASSFPTFQPLRRFLASLLVLRFSGSPSSSLTKALRRSVNSAAGGGGVCSVPCTFTIMIEQFFDIFIPCVDGLLSFLGILLAVFLLFVVSRLFRKVIKEIAK